MNIEKAISEAIKNMRIAPYSREFRASNMTQVAENFGRQGFNLLPDETRAGHGKSLFGISVYEDDRVPPNMMLFIEDNEVKYVIKLDGAGA
ncbi:MAG: hypothetical protein AAF582_00080 [Pseudomonadota bacterium]